MVQMVQTAASLLKISKSVNDNVHLPRVIVSEALRQTRLRCVVRDCGMAASVRPWLLSPLLLYGVCSSGGVATRAPIGPVDDMAPTRPREVVVAAQGIQGYHDSYELRYIIRLRNPTAVYGTCSGARLLEWITVQ
jgi:hypothetical protein